LRDLLRTKRIAKTFCAILSIALSAPTTWAEGPATTFRGLKLGVAVREQLPQCSAECAEMHGLCKDQASCWFDIGGGHGEGPHYYAHIADSYPSLPLGTHLIEEGGKLAWIGWTFYPSITPIVVENLTKKYGRPTHSTNQPISTKAGWKGTQQTRIWDRRDVYVELISPHVSIEQATVEVMTPERHRAEAGKAAEALKRMEGDL